MADERDEMTGLWRRPRFMDEIQQMIASPDGLALALIDVDYFKDVNDSFGQTVGDTLLKSIAAQIDAVAGGHAYRIGGDEFALLLPNTSLEQAFLRMEALRSSVQASAVTAMPDRREMTITIGVAQYPRDAKGSRELVSAAESALANAKEGGRNQVSLAPNEEMVMKTCYYSGSSVARLKVLAKRLGRSESRVLREALDDVLRKYDQPGDVA
jgi:diguanylate cyclase (GGDEF)-like protein